MAKKKRTAPEEQPIFRTLGTKSARRDLSREQPSTASDLDGIGTPDPMYQEGPDGPDLEPVRVYEGVDPAVKELEKQRAERREAAIDKRRAKGDYSDAEAKADAARYRRDAQRKAAGAKADNFSEGIARAASLLRDRKARERDERGRPEPVMGNSDLPETPPESSGGLVMDGQVSPTGEDIRTPEMRMRQQYNALRDQYIQRGSRANRDEQGNPISFREFMTESLVANPESELAKGVMDGSANKFFSMTKDAADAEYTAEEARKTDIRTDATESNRRTQMMRRDGGQSLLMDAERQLTEALSAAQQQGSTPDAFMQIAAAQQRYAALLRSMHAINPTMGFDQYAAEQEIAANRNRGYASGLMETDRTNVTMERIANSQNATPAEPSTTDRLREIINDPARPVAEQQAAASLAGPDASAGERDKMSGMVRAATARLEAGDVMARLAASNEVLAEGSPEYAAVARYAAEVDESTFVETLLQSLADPTIASNPALMRAKQKRDRNYLINLYRAARPQSYSIPSGL